VAPPSSPPPADPTDHLERETKLEAGPEFVLPELARTAGLPTGATVGEPAVLRLHATYFDTRRLDLARSRVTLRRREGGTDDGWHLKLPAGAGSRRELGVPLDASGRDHRRGEATAGEGRDGEGRDGEGRDGDTDARVPEALATLVSGLSRGRRLRPVARLVTVRTVRPVLGPDGTPLVEIADDDVTASRLVPGEDGGPQHWREIEVEVLDGTVEHMVAVCHALIAAGARPSGSASKLARAVGTDGEEHSRVSIGDTTTAGEVVLAGLRAYRQQLLIADVALRQEDPDADAAHDARAAARRIRAILSVYDPLLLPGSIDSLSRDLRRLGTAIGAARDLDVVAGRLLAGIARTEDRSGDHRQHADRMAAGIAEHRRRHVSRIRRTLTRPGHRSALRDLDALIDAPPWTSLAGSPAREVLPPLLTVAWFHLAALAEGALADPDTPAKAHDTRKAAKTVRYAAETATPALGPGAADLASFAEHVQGLLGDHQDAVTAAAFAARRGPNSPASTIPEHLADRLHDAEIAEAVRFFDAFRELWAGRPDLALRAAGAR
jgi:CHAD domain-containing protein